MIKQEYLNLLTEFGADKFPHSGRSLMVHLEGTHDLLAQWGASDDLCVAGLFHSIYGTEFFEIKSTDFSTRPRLAEALGARVEQTVYFFCVCERQEFFAQAGSENPVLFDKVTGSKVPCEPAMLRDLIELSVANEIEQWPDDHQIDVNRQMFYAGLLKKIETLISDKAKAAFINVLAKSSRATTPQHS